ncbi:MAG: DUF397 domain-containing protein [Pseudonocardiaceae bacterium]
MTKMRWRKSSYSGQESNCVELAWRKSSHSGPQSNCVELAHIPGAIRDSKNPAGPMLLVSDLPAFLREIKQSRLDPR